MGKPKKEPEFINPEEFVDRLLAFLMGAKGDEDTVAVGELRTMLNRVQVGGKLSLNNLRVALLTRIKDFSENNNGAGIAATNLWRGIREDYINVPLESVEEVLTDMVEEGVIAIESGIMTTYAPIEQPLPEIKS
jgi:hypothetical protein